MGTAENKLQRQIMKWADLNNIWLWRYNNLRVPGRKFIGLLGVPDMIGMIKPYGRFIGIEVKSKDGKQSRMQIKFMEKCRKYGGLYILARSLDDVIEGLKGG